MAMFLPEEGLDGVDMNVSGKLVTKARDCIVHLPQKISAFFPPCLPLPTQKERADTNRQPYGGFVTPVTQITVPLVSCYVFYDRKL